MLHLFLLIAANLIVATSSVDTDHSLSEDQQYPQQLRELIRISNIQRQIFNENQQSNRQNGTDSKDSSDLPISEISKDPNQPISGIGNSVQPTKKHCDHHTNKIIQTGRGLKQLISGIGNYVHPSKKHSDHHTNKIIQTDRGLNQPISNETRKWLKTSLSAIDKHNANRCNQIEEIPQANELNWSLANALMEERKNMLNKLSNSETITREDVSQLFDKISVFWEASVDRMAEFLKSLDAYKTDGRLKEAMEMEENKAKNKKQIAKKFNKTICSKLCKIIEKDVDESVLGLIRDTYQNLEIMQILATPEKQIEYVEHFQMYYFKKEDLGKQLFHAKDKAKQMPKPCAATKEACETAANCCVCVDKALILDYCCNRMYCLPCSLATLAIGSAISLPIDAVNGIRAIANKVKQKKIEENLQSVEKNIDAISTR